MSGPQIRFCLVNEGTQLTAYRADQHAPWFVITLASCHGTTPEEKAATFAEVVKFHRAAFGPLAEYKQIHAPSLPGLAG